MSRIAPPPSPSSAALSGWTIVSLAPSGGHQALRRAARRHGARLLAMSPLRWVALSARSELHAALAADRVIFSSPAAVRFAACQQALRARPGQCWLAVGAGTAAALRRHGIAEPRFPMRMDSEGLLAVPELQALSGLSVGLVGAPGGRGLLAEVLAGRAQALHIAHVYARQTRTISAAAWRRLQSQAGPLALAVSSAHALQAWLGQCPDRTRLPAMRVCASSERLLRLAREAGFAHGVRAANARPDVMIAALAGYRPDSAFR